MDQLATFVSDMPAWTGPDGLPLSWRHFLYGLRVLSRKSARQILDIASGVRGGMAVEDDYAGWRQDLGEKA